MSNLSSETKLLRIIALLILLAMVIGFHVGDRLGNWISDGWIYTPPQKALMAQLVADNRRIQLVNEDRERAMRELARIQEELRLRYGLNH